MKLSRAVTKTQVSLVIWGMTLPSSTEDYTTFYSFTKEIISYAVIRIPSSSNQYFMVHVTWAVCSGHCSVDSLNPFRHFKWIGWSNSYCWWKISCTTWLVWRTVNNGIFTISTGAGFLPSSVTHSWRLELWNFRFVSSYSRLSIHGGQETDSWKVGDWFPNPHNSSSKPLAKLLQPTMSFWTLDEVWISSIVQILTLTSISFFHGDPFTGISSWFETVGIAMQVGKSHACLDERSMGCLSV